MEPIIILHGLDTIYEKIKEWLQERPIQDDLVSAQVILNGWPYVNMAYPLLEQSLKALVLSLDKTYNPHEDKHSLNAIFERLDKLDKGSADRIRQGYIAFQSLHKYVSYRTLDEFIDNIDNDYVKWRYFPLEGWKKGKPAKISVEAMLEVARQTLDVLAGLVATDHGFRAVGTELGWKINNTLSRQVHLMEYEDGMADALNAWFKENNGSPVNGVAKMVWREQNEGLPVREQFKSPLSGVMENLMKALIASRDGDVQQFLRRAREAPLVWDSKNSFFQ